MVPRARMYFAHVGSATMRSHTRQYSISTSSHARRMRRPSRVQKRRPCWLSHVTGSQLHYLGRKFTEKAGLPTVRLIVGAIARYVFPKALIPARKKE